MADESASVKPKASWWTRRSVLEKLLLLAVLCSVLVIIGLVVFVVYQAIGTSRPCTTPDCITAASLITSSIDPSVDPCDDFFKFACGGFIKRTHGDRKACALPQLADQVDRRVHEVMQEPPREDEHYAIKRQKYLFQGCMNETAVGEEALEIMKDLTNSINGWPVVVGHNWKPRRFHWTNFVYKLRRHGFVDLVMFKFDFFTEFGTNGTRKCLLRIGKPVLEVVPDEHKEAYKRFMVNFAVKLGADKQYVEVEMANVMDFMGHTKKIIADTEKNGTSEMSPLKYTIEDFQAKHGNINWLNFINNVVYPVRNFSNIDYVIFPESGFVDNFFALIDKTPARVLANYMIWKAARFLMPYFPKDYRKLQEKYDYATDSEQPVPKDRFDFCKSFIRRTLTHLPTDVLYARNYVPEEKKRQAQEILQNIKSAFMSILRETSWLDQESKKRALQKAEALSEVIGSPGDYFDDEIFDMLIFGPKFDISRADATFFAVYLNYTKQRTDLLFSQTIEPTMIPMLSVFFPHITSVGAYYSPEANTIVIPAAILQGFIYDPNRPAYMNYGTLGSVLGHEFTHGFAKRGSTFDEDGDEANTWTNATEEAYDEKVKCLIEAAENFDLEDTDKTIDGKLTLEENIADFAGVKVSYAAYKRWVEEHGEEPRLMGVDYTPQQLFWISSILYVCCQSSVEELEKKLELDPHGPNVFRATAPIRNNPDFSKDFKCPEGSKMNPREKCQVF